MSKQTSISLRNQTIYSVFVRNHTPEGTFRALEADLPRIRTLGVDVLWLMPIHPIGKARRKGGLGCPYAISDYRAINPEYGSLEDFRHLVDAVHAHNMRCIIDVVYNHTSPDSWLAQHHPEWFYIAPDGKPGSRTPDWSDVADLDYSHRALWDYQIQTLCEWARLVDGFRCDVASAVPLEFWLAAREAVEQVRPGALWLAESVDPGFIREKRANGFVAHSDCELYSAFDICYDYDIRDSLYGYLSGRLPLSVYAADINRQEILYPANYVKLRCAENHDNPRIAQLIPNAAALRNFTAFVYLLKGTALLYGGQEVGCTHTPSLFDRDPVCWIVKQELTPLLRTLAQIKKMPILAEGAFCLTAEDQTETATVHYTSKAAALWGVFSLKGRACQAYAGAPNGEYRNLLNGQIVQVRDQQIAISGEPIVFQVIK